MDSFANTGISSSSEDELNSTTAMVRVHCRTLISLRVASFHMRRAAIEDTVKAFCKLVVSSSVHDGIYLSALLKVVDELSGGSLAERALASALTKMLGLARTLILLQRIPEFPSDDGRDVGTTAAGVWHCNILTEPLSKFVFGASNVNPAFPFSTLPNATATASASAFGETPSAYTLPRRAPPPGLPNKPTSPRFSIEANLAIAAIGATAIAGLMASGVKDSTFVRVFSAAAAVGFNCSLTAAFTGKHLKLTNALSKIGAISTAFAITIALGNTSDTLRYKNVNVNSLVIALICLIEAAVFISAY